MSAPGNKKPLNRTNIANITDYVKYAIDYFKGIDFNHRRTGFEGFVISLTLALYDEYVVKLRALEYLSFFKVIQDHLELFFGSLRSHLSFNNNPTAKQFQKATSYKNGVARTWHRKLYTIGSSTYFYMFVGCM